MGMVIQGFDQLLCANHLDRGLAPAHPGPASVPAWVCGTLGTRKWFDKYLLNRRMPTLDRHPQDAIILYPSFFSL